MDVDRMDVAFHNVFMVCIMCGRAMYLAGSQMISYISKLPPNN